MVSTPAAKTAILPRSLAGKDLKVVSLRHPKSGEPADFVVDSRLYQVVGVKKTLLDKRTIFFENNDTVSIYNPNVHVLVPVNPLFILLPTVFATPTLPLELVLDIAAGDWSRLPEDMARAALEPVCSIEDDMVSVDREKLNTHLRHLVSKVPVPASLVVKELDPEFMAVYQEFVGVNFVSSWLPEALQQHLATLFDFTALHSHTAEIIKKKIEANTVFTLGQRPQTQKRPLKAKESKAKKPANNRSLLDMFKKKT